MDAFTELTALSCALPVANIDTDQLIPARFMKEPRSVGYGQFLLHDLRFDDHGEPLDFPLNAAGAEAARILVASRNFGAGSSREAAVYALYDYGFRCVIAPSFGDIFAANAVNNGVLPALVSEADCDAIFSALAASDDGVLGVDLHDCSIRCGEQQWSFTITPVWRTKLLNGWDDIDLTEARRDDIDRFVERYRQARAWTIPNPGTSATRNADPHAK